jgi:excinuclease ABC subunit A
LHRHEPDTEENQAPFISIRGAKEHNLKNLSLTIPRHRLVVITGVSGSGKSTLAYDVLFSEGQRRYLESLAPYVRQYVRVMERPDVESVSGLPPTVAIQQRMGQVSRRSTVATLTEIYHFLRLLYSKLGKQHCPGCGRPMTTRSEAEIMDLIRDRHADDRTILLAPKVTGRKGFHREVLAQAFKKGYKEARIDGTLTPLQEGMALSRYHEHTIEVVVDRHPGDPLDLALSRALNEGNGSLILLDHEGREEIFSVRGICPSCGIGLGDLDPRLFSFNSRQGPVPIAKDWGRQGKERMGTASPAGHAEEAV